MKGKGKESKEMGFFSRSNDIFPRDGGKDSEQEVNVQGT